jgi:hypothetical protein
MAFDPLNFAADTGKTIASQVTGVASSLTSSAGNFISGLSKSGLSLDSLRSVAASKLDSLSNFLQGDTDLTSNFSRITQQQLVLGRSSSSSDPEQNIPKSQRESNTESITYPPDLGNHYLSVEFMKYDRPSAINQVKFHSEFTANLPLPQQLADTFAVRLSPQDTGLLGAVVGQVESAKKEFSSQGASDIKTLLNDSAGFAVQAGQQAVGGAVGAVLGVSGEQVVGTLGQKAGMIPNPHVSVFFQGVDVRPAIEFSWTFSPRNVQESAMIKYIIKMFKKRILPEVSPSAQNLMAYPHMVQLTLHPWKRDQTMPIYKRGLIEGMNVNYTPGGLSFFDDSSTNPVFVTFSFIFHEIEVFTANDFGQNNNIGDIAGYVSEAADKAYQSAKSGASSILSSAADLLRTNN